MKLICKDSKVEKQCTNLKDARKLFGGNDALARSLLSRINSLENAEVIKDIILMPPFHFHKLEGDRMGYFAIDVKSRKEPWRIILRPLNEKKEPYEPCNIDEIAGCVQIVGIMEVSKHYE